MSSQGNRTWKDTDREQIRRILSQPDFIKDFVSPEEQIILRSFIKSSKKSITDDERLILITILDKVVNIQEDILSPNTIRKAIVNLTPTLISEGLFDDIEIERLLDDLDDGEERRFAERLLSFDDEFASKQEQAILDFIKTGVPDSDFFRDVKNKELLDILNVEPESEPPKPPKPEPESVSDMQSQSNLSTDQMKTDQRTLDELREIEEQNEYIRRQILLLNQNEVKKKELEYITQEQDLTRFNRRVNESQKYKYDEQEQTRIRSEMAYEQQYLTMQTLANYKWGIPSMSDMNIKYSEDFFAS